VATPAGLLVHRADDTTGTMLFLHNLGDQDVTVDVSSLGEIAESPTEMFADRDYGDIELAKVTVGGYGYRWIRLRQELPL
jgi:maltose alpha-D-glucosyltransferase/alpha-amylase